MVGYVGNVIESCDKHMQYVVDIFQHSIIFDKDLNKAFELIRNKQVGE